MSDSGGAGTHRRRYDAAGIEVVRRQWGPFCRQLTDSSEDADAGTEHAVAYLQAGLSAEAVAALLRIRDGSQDPANRRRLADERPDCESVLRGNAAPPAPRADSAQAAGDTDR